MKYFFTSRCLPRPLKFTTSGLSPPSAVSSSVSDDGKFTTSGLPFLCLRLSGLANFWAHNTRVAFSGFASSEYFMYLLVCLIFSVLYILFVFLHDLLVFSEDSPFNCDF